MDARDGVDDGPSNVTLLLTCFSLPVLPSLDPSLGVNEPPFVAQDGSVPYGAWYGRRCGLNYGPTALSTVVVFT